MSNNSTTDPSKVLQDYAVGCDNPLAPPSGMDPGGTLPGRNITFDLPTSDPHVKNALWNNAGTVHISAG